VRADEAVLPEPPALAEDLPRLALAEEAEGAVLQRALPGVSAGVEARVVKVSAGADEDVIDDAEGRVELGGGVVAEDGLARRRRPHAHREEREEEGERRELHVALGGCLLAVVLQVYR
jgi:hypothetical protein